MGFSPQLGQTPRWELAERASSELHAHRLRLNLEQAGRLAGILGVTHVAVGQVGGTQAACTLTYQLYTAPARTKIGEPIKLAGSEDQIIAQLPSASAAVLTALGVKAQHAPITVGATSASSCKMVGHYPWYWGSTVSDSEQKQMDLLAQRLPLAELLTYVHHGRGGDTASTQHFMALSSGNFLMIGVLGTYITVGDPQLGESVDRQVAEMHAPNNAVLGYWAVSRTRSVDAQIAALERITRLAPNSTAA